MFRHRLASVLLSPFLLLVAACGGGDPVAVTFDLAIADGALAGDESTFVAHQGDTVTLDLTSDVHGEVHLHGYEIKIDIGPGEPASTTFEADATGRFAIEMHVTGVPGDDHGHDHDEGGEDVTLGALEIQPR
jgi:FtsP/CotA-like multicopper oxidase with cupredoxin domain